MIDYNKLKQAHELGAILSNTIDYPVFIAVQQEERLEGEICVLYTFRAAGDASIYRNIDDLIANLPPLTHPKPKYEVGQEVFYLFHRAYTTLQPDISSGTITFVNVCDETKEVYYTVNSTP